MNWKANLALAFLMATNCAISFTDDERESNLSGYAWGLATGCYLLSASMGAAQDRKKKKDKDKDDHEDKFDIM